MAPKRRSDGSSSNDEEFDPHDFEEQDSTDTDEAVSDDERVRRASRSRSNHRGSGFKDQGQPWSKAEVDNLLQSVGRQLRVGDREGQNVNWAQVAAELAPRTPKQCREKWKNDHRPGVRKGDWSQQEEMVLAEAHARHGNRWSEIVQYLPRRSENCIKNRW
jgi:hypothetical protein